MRRMAVISGWSCLMMITLCAGRSQVHPLSHGSPEHDNREVVVNSSSPVHLSASSSFDHLSGSTMATSPEQEATCFERIAMGTAYNGMAPHPDGSSRIFLSTQGEVWLASVPARESGGSLQSNDYRLFLDLSDRVLQLVGIAFHPEFTVNGRVFISYICDSRVTPTCGCSTAAGNGSMPSQYHLVVAEFSAKGGNGYSYSKATHADPAEVRRWFSMELPQQPDTSYNKHGVHGQILLGPTDNYLYLVVGHSVIMLDVDNSTPQKPKIFARGLNDPRGCSFGPPRQPPLLYCANVDQQQYERVYSISNVSSLVVIDHGRFAVGTASSFIGGRFYEGLADSSMNGRYLYWYGSSMQQAAVVMETPENSLPYASFSPIPINTRWCSGTGSTRSCSGAISGPILFFGEDNTKDLFIGTTDGLYRLVERGICSVPPPQASPPQSSHWPPLWTMIVIPIVAAVLATVVAFVLSKKKKLRHNENTTEAETPASAPQQVVFNIGNNNGQLHVHM